MFKDSGPNPRWFILDLGHVTSSIIGSKLLCQGNPGSKTGDCPKFIEPFKLKLHAIDGFGTWVTTHAARRRQTYKVGHAIPHVNCRPDNLVWLWETLGHCLLQAGSCPSLIKLWHGPKTDDRRPNQFAEISWEKCAKMGMAGMDQNLTKLVVSGILQIWGFPWNLIIQSWRFPWWNSKL